MGFKNWPYWIKGGALAFIIAVIINVVVFIFLIIDVNKRGSEAFAGSIFFSFTFLGGIILIIIGCVIGFIYGKINHK